MDSSKDKSSSASLSIGRELDIVEDDCLSTSVFIVGREFHSFDKLSSAVKDYECANFVSLYTRGSRSIKVTKKHAPKCHFSKDLRYSELDYACVHSSCQYKSHSKGIRKSQRLVLLALTCI